MTAGRRLHVTMSAGRLLISADETTADVLVASVVAKLATDPRAVTAAASATIEQVGDCVYVEVPDPPGRGRSPQVLVEVRVPPGSEVVAEAHEAEIVCTGELGGLEARTSSGSVHVEQVTGALDIRTGRGPVTVHRCKGDALVSVSDAVVIIRVAEGPLQVRARSGDVHVWALNAPAEVVTATGNVRLGWAATRPVHLDLQSNTGRVDAAVRDDPYAPDVVAVRTITGDIRVTPG